MDEAGDENETQLDELTLAIMNEDSQKIKKAVGKLRSFDDPCWMYGYRPLCTAYKNENYKVAGTILESDFLIQVNNPTGKKENTPLHWAILRDWEKSRSKEIEKLLKSGADINAENSLGQNPFDIALQTKNLPMLQLLVGHVSDNNINESTYLKLLLDLLNGDYVDLAEKLLTKCMHIDIKNSMNDVNFLILAVEKQYCKVVKGLLSRGIDVNYYDKSDKSSLTAIFKACAIGDLKMVKLLLDNGASVDIAEAPYLSNGSHYLPIHIAIHNGHEDVVEELLDRGVNTETYVCDNDGEKKYYITALQLACDYGNLETVKLLVERGANINKGKGSKTPIHRAFPDALFESGMGAYEYLLKFQNLRLDLDAAEYILFWCAQYDEPEKLLSVFEYIERLDPKDYLRYELFTKLINNGNLRAPLIHVAARNDAKECIDALVDNGVDVNLRNKKSRTAIHLAFRYRKFDSIVRLIRCGANINLVCNDNYLPIQYAVVEKLRESCYNYNDDDNIITWEEPDDPLEDDIDVIINYYGHYITKLKHLNLYVNDYNNSFALSKIKNPCDDQEKYEKEVKKMKQKKISCSIPYITYYDFAKASLNCRINCLDNPRILDNLSSQDNYIEDFPEFADIISNLFNEAFARKSLLDKFYDTPIFILLNMNLPYLCVKEIVDYFSNSELRNVVDMFTFFNKLYSQRKRK